MLHITKMCHLTLKYVSESLFRSSFSKFHFFVSSIHYYVNKQELKITVTGENVSYKFNNLRETG